MKVILVPAFLFITSAFIFSQSDLDCQNYCNGFFQFMGKHYNTVIFREGDYQIEYDLKTKQYVTIKLIWTGGCDYSFAYVTTNIKGLESRIG